MIHSVKFKALLDTNAIFPVFVRDLLFWFAFYDLYTPKWSDDIFKEWKDVMVRKGVAEEEANNRIKKADLAFPDALVQNYHNLVETLHLPDPDDRHVLAAAIKSGADHIVTNNLKRFFRRIPLIFWIKSYFRG